MRSTVGTCWRDHPRSRGVYRPASLAAATSSGSSPLARGLLLAHVSHDLRLGIIPARAGFTSRHCRTPIGCWDHPRSRGVYHTPASQASAAAGSSPLARGLPSSSGPPWSSQPDHPRSRGVYPPKRSRAPQATGSSPLARGLPGHGARPSAGRRIIPARAGFTRRALSTWPLRRDHPRSRGVYTCGSLESQR